MLDKRIQKVIVKLEKRSRYEIKNENKVPYLKRMLAISGEIGLFYNILLKGNDIKRVLEIGTSVGFSTLWFADAIKANGSKNKIITIENNHEKIQKANKNFKDANISKFVDIKEGNALQILKELKKQRKKFDFIFIDADKENYKKYFDLSMNLVKKRGIIAADNILLPKKYRSIMKEYVKYVQNRKDVQSVTIPLDYGEELSIRIK